MGLTIGRINAMEGDSGWQGKWCPRNAMKVEVLSPCLLPTVPVDMMSVHSDVTGFPIEMTSYHTSAENIPQPKAPII